MQSVCFRMIYQHLKHVGSFLTCCSSRRLVCHYHFRKYMTSRLAQLLQVRVTSGNCRHRRSFLPDNDHLPLMTSDQLEKINWNDNQSHVKPNPVNKSTQYINKWMQSFRQNASLTAMIFSLMPPTGRTLPVSDTSPVIARFCLTGIPVANDNNAVTMVQPALGPSFGVAPYTSLK